MNVLCIMPQHIPNNACFQCFPHQASSLSLSSRLRWSPPIQKVALFVHGPYHRVLLLLKLSDGALGLLELCADLLALLFHCGQFPLDQVILLGLLGSRHLTLTQSIRDKRRHEPRRERWGSWIKLHGGKIKLEVESLSIVMLLETFV